MADLTKLALLGAFLVVVGVLVAIDSWRHRGEYDPEDSSDIGNFVFGALGVAAIAMGVCFLVPPVVTAFDGGPWV